MIEICFHLFLKGDVGGRALGPDPVNSHQHFMPVNIVPRLQEEVSFNVKENEELFIGQVTNIWNDVSRGRTTVYVEIAEEDWKYAGEPFENEVR